MRKLLALFLVGCASGPGPSAEPATSPARSVVAASPARPVVAASPARPVVAASPHLDTEEPAVTINPPYVHGIRSVRFLKGTALRKEPRVDSAVVGVIRKGTYAGVQQAVPGGNGCQGTGGAEGRWIQIVPRGWACESVLEPSVDPPTAAAAVSTTPFDDDGAAPPVSGVYGFVRGAKVQAFASRDDALAQEHGRALVGANTVRATGVVNVDGRRFWRTTKGDLIDASSIAQISPSTFKGVAVEAGAALPAWVRSHRDAYKPVPTRATPSTRAAITGELAPRTVVTIVETSEDCRFVRVGDDAWVARDDVRRAVIAAPPPGTGAREKWFDIDLDQQVLVAYEGERPVYATLVSTGKYGHATPSGIARVISKLEKAVMTSEKGDLYSVADVPWTMYYDRDFALHTSYWHDGFGSPRSHGCVNLAPRDARLLYLWSSPDVPPGWTAVYGDAETPGSLVRVRSRAVPEPAFRGYARTLHERSLEVTSRPLATPT